MSPSFRWYGPELHFDRLELRSKDDQRVLARAAGGRVAADIWQLYQQRQIARRADRTRLAEHRDRAARARPASRWHRRSVLGGDNSSLETLTLNDLPAGKLAIRRGRGHDAELEFRVAAARIAGRQCGRAARRADLSRSVSARSLPPALGGTLSFHGTARGRGAICRCWIGASLASARGMSFPGWRVLLPEYLSRLDAGSGEFEVAGARREAAMLARADLDFARARTW